MKLVAVFLALAFVAMMVADTEAGWWRRRRRSSNCRWQRGCYFYGGRLHCYLRYVCGRKRRAAGGEPSKSNLHVTPLPENFAFYDLNDDGKVDLQEFAATLGMTEDEARSGFEAADKNNDGSLSHKELMNAPFLFEENQPDEGDDEDGSNSSSEEDTQTPTSPPPQTTTE